MTSLLHGVHDREGRHIVPSGGWCLDVVALSESPTPTDYSTLRADINWIVRLSWGFGTTGNIPLPHEYDKMAAACVQYVAKSSSCNIYIIGNEPNHENERPNGVYITPQQYATCFRLCRDAIKRARPDAQVIPAPCAPYHANPVRWVDYWREMLTLIASDGGCDGIAVHTYTRSSDPADIDSAAKMEPPLADTFSGFGAYEDALDAVPVAMRHLPAYITEFNELLPDGWDNRNTGVVQAAYGEIDDWNRGGSVGSNLIHCLILYRWPMYDRWYIEGKQGVIDDFNAAVAKGYKSPETAAVLGDAPQTVHLPQIAAGGTHSTPQPAREWDSRLDGRGVKVIESIAPQDAERWELVKARWWDEAESQGRHHIYVEALDENGQPLANVPFKVIWPSDVDTKHTNGRSGVDAGNFPMSKSLNEFSVKMGDGLPSDIVTGIGMGANGNSGIHTSTGLTFQRVKAKVQQPAQTETSPQVMGGTTWQRARAFVARWEGGYQNNPADVGNWTGCAVGQGENKGTKFGISACSYPHLDIVNLTEAEADAIYFRDYWQASGADKLPWPYALLAFDTAVLHGVGTARKWMAEVGDNPYAFAARRLRVYTKLGNWSEFGAGWTNRVSNLLEEASK